MLGCVEQTRLCIRHQTEPITWRPTPARAPKGAFALPDGLSIRSSPPRWCPGKGSLRATKLAGSPTDSHPSHTLPLTRHSDTLSKRVQAGQGRETPASRDPDRLRTYCDSVVLRPSLLQFTRFEGPDRAAPRAAWLEAIDETLPASGAGLDEVLSLLSEVVIARGL